MSKMIKKSKGEVMALMAGMQNEGVFNLSTAGEAQKSKTF